MDIYEGKRQHQQESVKSSRASTPEPAAAVEAQEFRPILRTPPPFSGPPPSPPVPTSPIAPVPPEPTSPICFKPCPVCGRTFNPESFSKHVNICQKAAAKKRKMFDSSRQRREGLNAASEATPGTDLEQFLPKNFGLPENSPFLEKSPPPTAKPTPKPKPCVKTLMTKPASDLQRCPHCNRAFGVRAFERHVEWCADKAKILPAAPTQPPPHIADAKQRLNARTQYKAPLSKRGRKTSQSRDKSHSRSGSVESSRGVSPPREFADFKHSSRPRASESASSTENHEESSAHVPVIRNSRPHGSVSGDVNVKARQARLARDLSSSRNSQESKPREQNPPPNGRDENSQTRKETSRKENQQRNRHSSTTDETDTYASSRRNENDKVKCNSKRRPVAQERKINVKEDRYQSPRREEKSQIHSPRKIHSYTEAKIERKQSRTNARLSLREVDKKPISRETPSPRNEKNYIPHEKIEGSLQSNDQPWSGDDNYCQSYEKRENSEPTSPRYETNYPRHEKIEHRPQRNKDRRSFRDNKYCHPCEKQNSSKPISPQNDTKHRQEKIECRTLSTNERLCSGDDNFCQLSEQVSRGPPSPRTETNYPRYEKKERVLRRNNNLPRSDEKYCQPSEIQDISESPSPPKDTKHPHHARIERGPHRNDWSSSPDEKLHQPMHKVLYSQPLSQIEDRKYPPLRNNERAEQDENYCEHTERQKGDVSRPRDENYISSERNQSDRSECEPNNTSTVSDREENRYATQTRRKITRPALQRNRYGYEQETEYSSPEKCKNDLLSSPRSNSPSIAGTNRKEYPSTPQHGQENNCSTIQDSEDSIINKTRPLSPTDKYNHLFPGKNNFLKQNEFCSISELHDHPSESDEEYCSTFAKHENQCPNQSNEKKERNIRPTSYIISHCDKRLEEYHLSEKRSKNKVEPKSSVMLSPRHDSNNSSPREHERRNLPAKLETYKTFITNIPIVGKKGEPPCSPRVVTGKRQLPVRHGNRQTSFMKSEAEPVVRDEGNSQYNCTMTFEIEKNNQHKVKNECKFSAKDDADGNYSPSRRMRCKDQRDKCSATRERYLTPSPLEEINDINLLVEKESYPPAERFEISNTPRIDKCDSSAEDYLNSVPEENACGNESEHQARCKDNNDLIKYREESCNPTKNNNAPSIETENKDSNSENMNVLESTQPLSDPQDNDSKITVKETVNQAAEEHKAKQMSNKSKEETEKLRDKLSIKKQQKLKNLEELAQKYEARTKKLEEQERLDGEKMKSLIPVSKRRNLKDKLGNKADEITEDKNATEMSKDNLRRINSSRKKNLKLTSSREKVANKQTIKLNKGSAISVHSVESEKGQDFKAPENSTELLCPCVPCVIHKPGETKTTSNKKGTKSYKSEVTHDKVLYSSKSGPKVELVYKNESLLASCTTIITENVSLSTPCHPRIDKTSSDNSVNSNIAYNRPVVTTVSDDTLRSEHTELDEVHDKFEENLTNYSVFHEINDKIEENVTNLGNKNDINNINDSTHLDNNNNVDIYELTSRNLEETYEPDLRNSDDIFDSKSTDTHKEELNEKEISPQGSNETYTKFSTNLDDLEEFINATDEMMIKDNEKSDELATEELIEALHISKTVSLDPTLYRTSESVRNLELEESKPQFSDAFEDMKNNLIELIKDTRKNLTENNPEKDHDEIEKRLLRDFERPVSNEIELGELHQESCKSSSTELPSDTKLPSINLNNKPERQIACLQKEVKYIYKSNWRYKMDKKYNEENKNENHDLGSSKEELPLKLPKIEQNGLDDNYDPFASAARQMKELMSSDTNLPKKVLDSYKDPNRTLPILRPKEKTNLSTIRSDNTKLIKDSLNKTYQKTPTLQRLKSFGGSNNENQNISFGARCSSFRVNRQTSNDKKSSQKLNTTFTKSSKENILTAEKNYFNRNSSLNRSFSSYTASSYSTPKPKDRVPKISPSLSHSFQRTTIKQPVKLDKIKKEVNKKDFVNLDSILADSHISDNSSMTDSNYIDPRLINENDNLPINVNTILNNPDMLSSMESLLTQHKEILPTKFDSFSHSIQNNNNNKDCDDVKTSLKLDNIKNKNINNNLNNKIIGPFIDDLSIQYDKIMSSLEHSLGPKTSIRDDDSICEDFDLEEFMISFDEEVNKQTMENKRTCSSTTRVVKPADLADDVKTSDLKDINLSPKVVCNGSNGLIAVNKSMSLNFSSNIVSENLFPPSMKRSNSLIESMQRKPQKTDSGKSRLKNEQMESDILHSLKEIDRINGITSTDCVKRDARIKYEKNSKNSDNTTNGNHTPNGKHTPSGKHTPNGKCSDSAYSSLNRVSPSKLSVCNSKSSNGVVSLEQIPAESDSSGCNKDDLRSLSSDEFLAMERSAELGESLSKVDTRVVYNKETDYHEKRTSSRASSRLSAKWRSRQELSSSGSEASLPGPRRDSAAASPPVRLSRFCHECGSKFPVDTAKFCIDCGVKRLIV